MICLRDDDSPRVALEWNQNDFENNHTPGCQQQQAPIQQVDLNRNDNDCDLEAAATAVPRRHANAMDDASPKEEEEDQESDLETAVAPKQQCETVASLRNDSSSQTESDVDLEAAAPSEQQNFEVEITTTTVLGDRNTTAGNLDHVDLETTQEDASGENGLISEEYVCASLDVEAVPSQQDRRRNRQS